jgi:hypothetical protein
MTHHDIDLAIKRLRRRLDKIMACTSGMPNYPSIAKRVSLIREAIESVEGREQRLRRVS